MFSLHSETNVVEVCEGSDKLQSITLLKIVSLHTIFADEQQFTEVTDFKVLIGGDQYSVAC